MTFGHATAYAVNTTARGQFTGGAACTFSQLYRWNAERLAWKQLVPLNRKWLCGLGLKPGLPYSRWTFYQLGNAMWKYDQQEFPDDPSPLAKPLQRLNGYSFH